VLNLNSYLEERRWMVFEEKDMRKIFQTKGEVTEDDEIS
jgi:hypothetical protein